MVAVANVAERPPAVAVIVDQAPVCWRCGRRLAEYLTRPWSLRCHRCRAQNRSARD